MQLINSVIASNTGQGVNILSGNDQVAVYHNVIADNGVGLNMQTATTSTAVYNNIFYTNAYAVSYEADTLAGADYNDYYANTAISSEYATLAELQAGLNVELNSLEVDPEFVDPVVSADRDFHVLATSPLIDAGYDLSSVVVVDRDDETRPYGTGFDIGFDELPVVPMPTSLKVKKITAHQATVRWQIASGYSVTKYKVEYSRKKSFTNPKRVSAKTTKKTLTKLKAGTKYFVRVKAVYQTDYAKYKSAKTTAKRFTTKQVSE